MVSASSIVEDDGIGMSEHTLTGPLIEFGKSFWASEEAQEEFPGLVSKNLHQTGTLWYRLLLYSDGCQADCGHIAPVGCRT